MSCLSARPKATTSTRWNLQVQPHGPTPELNLGSSCSPAGPEGIGAQLQARFYYFHTAKQPSGISLCSLLDSSQLKEREMNSGILAPKALGSLIIGCRRRIKCCSGCSKSVIHCPWLPEATLAGLEKTQPILYTEYPRTHLQAHEYHNIQSILCVYISVFQTENRTRVGDLAFPVIKSNFFPLKGEKTPNL